MTEEAKHIARSLADQIKSERTGLDYEDNQAAGIELRHYARAKKWRDQDRAKIRGMVIALTYVLGRPNDIQLAEEFIAGASDCTCGAMELEGCDCGLTPRQFFASLRRRQERRS